MLAEQQQRMDSYDYTCASYGFKPDTKEFSTCLMEQDLAYKEQKAVDCKLEKLRQENDDYQPSGKFAALLHGMTSQSRLNKLCD